MSWTLDLIIIAIFAITVFFAAKNGFVKTAISAVSFIVAILITACFAGTLAGAIKTTAIADKIETATERKIEDVILESSLDAVELVNGKSEAFNVLLSVSRVDQNDLKEFYDSLENKSFDPAKRIAKKVSEPIIDTVALIIAIIVLFFGTRILLSIVSSVLDNVAKLPILKSCNKLLGVLLGILLAVVRISLFCFVVGVLITHADFLGNDYISALDPESTHLFRFFNNINIFGFFL